MKLKDLNKKEQKILEKLHMKGHVLIEKDGTLIVPDFVGLESEEKKLLLKIIGK